MDINYIKLHKKMRLMILLKIIVAALSVGICAISVFLAVSKLLGSMPELLWLSAVGVGAAFVTAGILLLFMLPTKKRIAKQIDKRLGLNEKVQTMVEFSELDSTIAQMQREDTMRILSEKKKKDFRSKRAWTNAIMPLVATALAITAFAFVPLNADEPLPPPDTSDESDAWELTEGHRRLVLRLIEDVNDSQMQNEGKTDTVKVLEDLLEDLKPVKSKKTMTSIVTSAMVDIADVSKGLNTYSNVVAALKASPNAQVIEFAAAMGTPRDPIEESKYAELTQKFANAESVESVKKFATSLSEALGRSEAPVGEASLLHDALGELAKETSAFADANPSDAEGIKDVLQNGAEGISAALAAQNANRTMSDKAINELAKIFGIPPSDIPPELLAGDDVNFDSSDSDRADMEDEDEDIINPGGYGSGDVIYGSNDSVYDPATGTFVKYGDILNEYDGKKTGILDSGKLPDELGEFIEKYFGDLYNKKENKD